MIGTIDIDIDHQIVGQLTETLTDDQIALVVRLNRAEREGDFGLTSAFDSHPAIFGENAQNRVVLTVKMCEWSQSEQTDNQPNVQYFLAKSHMNRVFYS